jgi:hypothetical protein
MRLQFRFIALGILLIAAGCHHRKPVVVAAPAAPAPPPAPPPPPADDMQALDATARIYYDDAAAFTDSVRLTIRDVDTWRAVWSQATQAQATAPPLPAIDFSRQMVLLVSSGRMKPGDEIHVDSIGKRKGRFFAIVRTTVACQPFPSSAYPLEIVRVRRTEGSVVFVERRGKAEDC